MACPANADNSFGPQYCQKLDFTLLFEQSLLQIAPCLLFLLSLPIRTLQLQRQTVKTQPTGIRAFKQLAVVVLAALQFGLLIAYSVLPELCIRTSLPSTVIAIVASLALLYLSSIEHSRSARPSSTINAYIFFSILLEIPQARSLWLRHNSSPVPGLFTAALAVKVVVFYLEARSKRSSLLAPYSSYAPESLVNLYDRIVLWWLKPLFLKGYGSVISMDGLLAIDQDLSSDKVERKFNKHWQRSLSSKRPLITTLRRALWLELITMGAPRLFLSAFRLSQPLLIRQVTSWLSKNDSNVDIGHSLIGAAALVYIGMALTNVISKRQFDRFSTKLRAILISVIHSKSLCLSAEQLSDGAVLTLISNDANRICTTLQQLVDLFSVPLEVSVAIYLLSREIGVAAVAPVAFSLIITVISFLNSSRSIPLQRGWLVAIQERISYTAAVLGCPKGFKMLGLTSYFRDRIQGLRVAELNKYAQYRKFVTFRNAFAAIPDNVAPALTLMMFALIHQGRALTPSIAFTALSLISILTKPIQEIIFAVPSLITALASVKRIESFLLLDGGKLVLSDSDASSSSLLTADGVVELQEQQKSVSHGGLELKDVTVCLGKDNKIVLRSVSATITPATLTLIVGPVGSGKSTLLRTITGDIPATNGQVQRSSQSIGYCSQEAWLPNKSIKDIVMGESEWDDTWYATVMEACALASDISALPAEMETMVGNKGVSLSGGQKQRLSLARALYSRKNLLVLDDILSGLDARSAKHVVKQVLGPDGVCKKHGITVIMATHAVEYLHYADHIVALNDKGSIEEQGSFQELDAQDGYVHNLRFNRDKESLQDEQEKQQDENRQPVLYEPVVSREDENDESEELARRTGDSAVYKYYVKSIGWKFSSIIVFTAVAYAFANRFPELWVRWWSEEKALKQHPLGVWIGVYILIACLAIVCLFSQIWVMLVWSVPRSSSKLHEQLLDTVMNAPYSFFVNTDSGVTLNRFANDMSLIELQLADAVMHTQNDVYISITSAVLIAIGARYVGILMPFAAVLLYFLQKFYLRTSRQLRFMDIEAQAPLLTHCQETISGVTTIRAFKWQHSSHSACLQLLDRSQKPYYLMLCIQRWLNLVLDLTTAAIATVVVALAMTLHGTASAGSVGLSLLNILNFNTQLAQLILDWTSLETSLGAVARCKNFEAGTPSEHLAGESVQPASNWPQSGHITMDNITATYAPGKPPALDKVTLSIPAGFKVGICGRSGSGKSSLLLTLFRMLDPSSGEMYIDGVNVTTLPREVIRDRITPVPQEAVAVPGSVRTNLDPMDRSTDEAIFTALEKVGLLELINERGGINAELSDLGLSQGQLQLFAVARALLRPSKLVVVDEMTSSVDQNTEERILKLVKTEFQESTVIAVAHRLQTIADFDMIVVMDKGQVVELGRPEELLEKQDGYFSALWKEAAV
ncbi:hypothetical protein VHEMI06915 [[Torrubiella] hemipterigena]|uniref:ABC transporter n=1 Tax=[Torrubiella] hemipterigena TaxID=1531966 RepID=A0A0A1TKC3_9HYPO|nr:hypothetical protein VHEMI06915 [[Torrubiella] hemipterigena]